MQKQKLTRLKEETDKSTIIRGYFNFKTENQKIYRVRTPTTMEYNYKSTSEG